MSPEDLEDLGRWFLGSLDSNKCDFMRIAINLLKKVNGNISNLIVKICYKNTSDYKNNMICILNLV